MAHDDNEEHNGLRLVKLLDEATLLLKKFLLNFYNNDINQLIKDLQKISLATPKILKKALREEQLNILFPKEGTVNPDDLDDISLLYTLLRVTKKIKRPKTGWNDEPLNTDCSEQACVVRIHFARNELAHKKLCKTQTEFHKYLDLIGKSMQNLGCDIKIINDIINMQSDSRAREILEEKEEELKDLQEKNRDLSERLERLESNEEVWFDVMPLIPSFTGRKDEVQTLHQKIITAKENVLATIIIGLPGTGKTTLARFYCYEYQQEYNNHVCWINASSKENLHNSFVRLANELQIIDGSDTTINITKIYRYFANTKVLFIFDNCEDPNVIEPFLPRDNKTDANKPTILMTAKKSIWGARFLEHHISPLLPSESIELLKNSIPEELVENDEDLTTLATKLSGYPLALQQVIAYIKNFIIPVNQHIHMYENLMKSLEFPSEDKMYGRELTASLQMIFNELKKEDIEALRVLRVLSMLDCTNIDATLIKHYLGCLDDHNEKLLIKLSNLSLIRIETNYSKRTRHIVIHGLVQKFVIANLTNEVEYQNCVKETSQLLAHFAKADRQLKIGDSNTGKLWLHHITYMFQFLSDNMEFLTKICEIKRDISEALKQKGNENEAITILKIIIKHYILLSGKTNKQVFDSLNLLQRCQISIRHWNEALDTVKEAEDLSRKLYKPGNERITDMLHNKALCFSKLGKTDEAIDIYKEVYNSQTLSSTVIDGRYITGINFATELQRERRYTEALNVHNELLESIRDIPKYLTSMEYYEISGRKMEVYSHLGKREEAINMMRELIMESETNLGLDNTTTIDLKWTLANIFLSHRKYDKSLELLQGISVIVAEKMSKNHPKYFDIQTSTASCLKEIGRLSEALEIYEKLKTKTLEYFHENHDDVLGIEKQIASCYFKQGEFNKSLELYEIVLEKQKYLFGLKNRRVLITQQTYAYTLYMVGDYKNALNIYTSLKEIYEDLYGDTHVNVYTQMNWIALCKEKMGYFNEALEIHNLVIAYCKQNNYSDEFPLCEGSTFNRAICWLAMGKTEEAYKYFKKQLEKRIKANDLKSFFGIYYFSVSCLEMRKINECRKYLAKTLNLGQTLFTSSHVFVLRVLLQYALCDFYEAHYEKAEKSCHEILTQCSQLRPSHLLVVNTRLLIAQCVEVTNKISEAIKICKETLKNSNEILHEQHPIYKPAYAIIEKHTR